MLLDLSYLSYPLPPDIQRLYEAGDFARMDRVIRLRLDDPRVPEALKARLRVQTELAYEILRAYPYTQAQMLEILKSHVKDFEEEELETLRDDGTLDWRYVNGEVRFKNNALSGLLKTRAEYAARATDPEVKNGAKESARQLHEIIAKMKANGGVHARFELHEQLTIRSDRLTPGETLRVHLPMPIVGAQVKSAALLGASHPVAFLAPEDEPQRTIYFELPYQPGMTVSADVAYEIDAPYQQPHARDVYAEQPVFDTEEQPPHVVFTPYLRALAKEIVGGRDERAAQGAQNLRFHHHAGGLSFHAAVSDGDEHSGILPERAARRLRRAGHHVCDALPPVRRSGAVAERPVYQAGQRGAPRLGAVLCRAVRVAVRGLLVRRLGLSRGRSGSLEFLFRQPRAVAHADVQRVPAGVQPAAQVPAV